MKCEVGNYIIYSQISLGTVLQSSLEVSIKLDVFQGCDRTLPVYFLDIEIGLIET